MCSGSSIAIYLVADGVDRPTDRLPELSPAQEYRPPAPDWNHDLYPKVYPTTKGPIIESSQEIQMIDRSAEI